MGRSAPSLALVMCLRDEAELLRANLAYHHALGVSRAYLFLDRCTDGTEAIARSFSWVDVIQRNRDPEDRFMSAHQVKCLNDGLERARCDGIEWLMHVDADEFACGDDRSEYVRLARRLLPLPRWTPPEERGALPAMLARVCPKTEMVILPPKDVIPLPLPGKPFWKHHYFHINGKISRPMLDPSTGEVRRLENRIGHQSGKSIVRTDAEVEALSAHRWTRHQAHADRGKARPSRIDIPSEYRGFLYHFTVISAAHWLKKHRKFAEYPSHWERGKPVPFPKQAWKEASINMSEDEAQAYYENWVCMNRRQLVAPMLRGHVTRETFVDDLLTRLGQDARAAPPQGKQNR